MYNHLLDTFIKVADAGSFNKAAEELFISPNAIMKQINLLEDNLGFELFKRTHRGIKLTPAGKSLYKDAKYIIEYSRYAIIRAKAQINPANELLRIGTSLTTPVQFLVDLWPQILTFAPSLKFELVSFENTPENAREIMRNFGSNIDFVARIYSENLLKERQCQALKLYDAPIYCAMSKNHPLASKDELEITDLFNQNVMMIRQGYLKDFDTIRKDIVTNYHDINIVDIPFFNVDVFNRCENEKMFLLTIKEWANIHPLLKIVPIKWDYKVPLGILYSKEPSAKVQLFLKAIKEVYHLQYK